MNVELVISMLVAAGYEITNPKTGYTMKDSTRMVGKDKHRYTVAQQVSDHVELALTPAPF